MPDLLTPSQVADFMLAESRERGEILTNLKLQKLVYYAQAWHLALYEQPLFAEDCQAWVHGPVIPSLYRRFRDYRWQPITSEVEMPDMSEALRSHLEEILDVFGPETAVGLEIMTHREQPWLEARGDLGPTDACDRVIPKASMAAYYRELGNGQN